MRRTTVRDGLRGRMNGGFTATVTTSSPAALPVDSHGSPIFLVGCRPGERTGTFFIRTQPVEANTLVFISVKGGGTTIRKSLSVTKGSLDLRIRDIEVTQAIQYLDDPTFDDNSLPLVKGKPTVVRVHLDSNTSQQIHQVSVSLKSRPVGSSQDDWTHHPPLWPRATVWSVSEITRGGHDAEYIRNYTRNSPLTHRDPYNVSFLIDP